MFRPWPNVTGTVTVTVGLNVLVTSAFTSITTLWPSVMAIPAPVEVSALVKKVSQRQTKTVPLRLVVMEMVMLAAEAHSVMVHVPAKLVVVRLVNAMVMARVSVRNVAVNVVALNVVGHAHAMNV